MKVKRIKSGIYFNTENLDMIEVKWGPLSDILIVVDMFGLRMVVNASFYENEFELHKFMKYLGSVKQ